MKCLRGGTVSQKSEHYEDWLLSHEVKDKIEVYLLEIKFESGAMKNHARSVLYFSKTSVLRVQFRGTPKFDLMLRVWRLGASKAKLFRFVC